VFQLYIGKITQKGSNILRKGSTGGDEGLLEETAHLEWQKGTWHSGNLGKKKKNFFLGNGSAGAQMEVNRRVKKGGRGKKVARSTGKE